MALEVPAGTPDRRPGIEALCIVLIILTTLGTIIRIISRFIIKQSWWWDDFFAILSLPAELVLLSLVLAWCNIGLGLHTLDVEEVNPLLVLQGAKYLFVAIFFFDTSICLPKLAAIFFYARVFRVSRTFRIHLWIAGVLVSCWLFSAYISTIFQCSPIEKAWNATLPGTCISTFPWYLSTSILSTIFDFYILLLPVPMIWMLNVSLRQRILLLVAFFMAYSVIVLSLGRLVSTVTVIPKLDDDPNWFMTDYLYWACLEGSISIISISVPNAVALVRMVAGDRLGSRSTSALPKTTNPSYVGNSYISNKQTYDKHNRSFEQLVSSKGSGLVSEIVSPDRSDDIDRSELGIAMNNIRIQTDIRVTK